MGKKIESPCVNVCTYDHNQVCLGCGRTEGEISNWIFYSDEERAAIMKRLGKYPD